MDMRCGSCLSSDRRLGELKGSIRNLLFDLIPEIYRTGSILLCWECRAQAQNVYKFCIKVQESQNLLFQYAKNAPSDYISVEPKSNLVTSDTKIYSYPVTTEDTHYLDNYYTYIDSQTNHKIIKGNDSYQIPEVTNKVSSIQNSINKDVKRDSPYCCKVCGKSYKTRGKYEYHKEVHEAKPQCKECGEKFLSKSTLWRHRNLVHKSVKKYSCDTCKKIFFTEAGYQSHISSHTESNNQYFCHPCGKFFKTNSSFRKHQRSTKKHVDSDTWKYNCPHCDRKFPSEPLFKEHCNNIHLNTKRFMCKQCPRQYCTMHTLRIHVKSKHENVTQHRDKICELCGKIFKTFQVLQSHIRTHTGERPYACSVCPARFTQSGALRTHTRLLHHHNE